MTEPDRPRNQYGDEMCITEMCMELHRGNPDHYRTVELISFLRHKLDRWGSPQFRSGSPRFDDAVRELVTAALDEYGS